jgi:hypothetical protein
MQDADFHGCIFVHAAMEFPLPHDPAHEAALRNKRGLEDFFYELAERAGADDPGGLTKKMLMIMEGAYVTRAVTGEARTIDTARQLVEQTLSSHLPSTNTKRM